MEPLSGFRLPSLFRTLFFVAITAAALVVIDTVLASTERLETAKEGSRFYNEGLALTRKGNNAAAIESFKSAIANARENPEYRLALGRAQRGTGLLDDAEATLSELLKGDSMAGAPNLALARVYAREGRMSEAAVYYHRAIFGQWKQDAIANQVKTRSELADLLAANNSKAELLAELLPLEEQTASDAGMQKKIAHLYITAGSPARAAGIFLVVARIHPADFDAHQGLGDAEFALGNYSAAQAAYAATLRLRPKDQELRRRWELSGHVIDLDPTRKGLSGQERYRRSILVLEQVLDAAKRCQVDSQQDHATDLASAASTAVKRHVGAAEQSDAVEANLDLAARLWKIVKPKCAPADSATDEPLDLVLAKAAQ